MLLPLLLFACAGFDRHSTTAAFPTRQDATAGEFLAVLEGSGWKITEEEQNFHFDPRGLRGVHYELERVDGKGFASLFVFDAEVGNGSLMMDVAEDIEGGRMFELIEGLRVLYDAAPTWRDRGVVYCLDHDPRHALWLEDEGKVEEKMEELREKFGCKEMSWNDLKEEL
jgi:hypothetical protein